MSLLLSISLAVLVGAFITWIVATLLTPPSPGGGTSHSGAVTSGAHGAPSPGTPTPHGAHAPAHGEGDHAHSDHSSEKWWERALVLLIVIATIGGVIWLLGPGLMNSVTRLSENRAREKSEKAIYDANPDNHNWVGSFRTGEKIGKAHGVRLSTDKNTRSFTLRWKSTEYNCEIVATGMPGSQGRWIGTDTHKTLGGEFNINFKDDHLIRGLIQTREGKLIPCEFRRSN